MFKNQHADLVIFETAQRDVWEDGGWYHGATTKRYI